MSLAGELRPKVRARICDGLGFLGIELGEDRNMANAGVIYSETSGVPVPIIPTDEERMIARMVSGVLGLDSKKEN